MDIARASATSQAFVVGDIVYNFGNFAQVLEIRDGRTMVVRGFGLSRSCGLKWVADPFNCTLVDHEDAPVMHKDGLTALG